MKNNLSPLTSHILRIVSVVGARPNFIKMAPLIRAIDKHNKSVNTLRLTSHASRSSSHLSRLTSHILIHTGQHYDYEMSKVFFEDLELPEPDIYLGVGSGTHAEQTARIMLEFEKVLLKQKPDVVIVVGDVNSTLACALATAKFRCTRLPDYQLPLTTYHGRRPLLAHVEAGLRSFDRSMPEEINRKLTDAISDFLFTPSPDADENLKKEGIPKEKIYLVGDIMVDSLLANKEKAKKSKILEKLGLRKSLSDNCPLTTDYALLTLHRPSNVDNKENLTKIIKALKEISKRIPIIFPAHPRTQKRLAEFGLLPNNLLTQSSNNQSPITSYQLPVTNYQFLIPNSRFLLIDPLGYLDFLSLEMNAEFVMTDSGGIQKEATLFNVPCLTLRNTTEWGITITQGTNVLVWNNTEKIVEEAFKILDGKRKQSNGYKLWDGKTAKRIVEVLTNQPRYRAMNEIN